MAVGLLGGRGRSMRRDRRPRHYHLAFPRRGCQSTAIFPLCQSFDTLVGSGRADRASRAEVLFAYRPRVDDEHGVTC